MAAAKEEHTGWPFYPGCKLHSITAERSVTLARCPLCPMSVDFVYASSLVDHMQHVHHYPCLTTLCQCGLSMGASWQTEKHFCEHHGNEKQVQCKIMDNGRPIFDLVYLR